MRAFVDAQRAAGARATGSAAASPSEARAPPCRKARKIRIERSEQRIGIRRRDTRRAFNSGDQIRPFHVTQRVGG